MYVFLQLYEKEHPFSQLGVSNQYTDVFAQELGQASPFSQRPANTSRTALSKPRSMSTSMSERRGRVTQRPGLRRRQSPSTQHLVLLYPNSPHLQFHPVLPTFPLSTYPVLLRDDTSSSLDCLPQARQSSTPIKCLSRLANRSTSPASSLSPPQRQQHLERLRLSGIGLAGSRLNPLSEGRLGSGLNRQLNMGRIEAGHYSDDSTFQRGLPRRASSQPNVKFPKPTLASVSPAYASEFRPLGYYPHLSRHQVPPRPSYLPLSPVPMPDRPTSLCVLGTSSYSDSDSELFYPYYCPALGKVLHSGPVARMRISSGSLHLDEEEGDEDEELCNRENTTVTSVKVMKL